MRAYYTFLILFLLFFSTSLQSKSYHSSPTISFTKGDIIVKGKVMNENKEALDFVSVFIKGTNTGVYTDEKGNYEVSAPENGIIIFSYLGYETQEIQILGQKEINVTLVSSSKQLDQVVVIGYGTSRKMDVTGSSTRLKGKDIEVSPYLTATQSIQGKAAGVQVINSGAPGSAPNIRIRGTGSILGGADPLYVVDGIITSDIRNINVSDILSIDILKDASSTAIYGARAANGVVLITTKSGSKSAMSVSYNNQLGFRILTNRVKMSPPGYYAQYSNDAADFPAVKGEDVTGKTDWYKEITRAALFQNHNLSFSGKKNKYKYYLSGGFVQENGILLDNDYKRYNIRYNHEYAITSKLTLGNTIGLSRYVSNNQPYSLFSMAYIAAPIYNALNDDGTWGNTSNVINNVGNPLASIKNNFDRSYGNRYQSTVWGEYKILKNLTFKSQIGGDLEHNNGWTYTPEYYTYTASGIVGGQFNEMPDLSFRRDTIYQWVWDNVLSYEVNIGSTHNIKFVAGHTAERRDGWSNSAVINNYAIPNNSDSWVLNFTDTTRGQQNLRDPISNYFRRESYFGRINYRLLDRYLLNATFRRDANSNFPASNRWGNFPSLGLGWIISNEPFLKNHKSIDELKFRASYGLVGNDVIRPGQFDLRPAERLYAYFGTDRVDGAIVTSIVDPNLKWEVVKEFDLGLEFSLWNSKITGEIDYYHKLATDALYTIPYASLGFGNSLLTNAANILNTGIEIALAWNHRYNENLSQTIRFNITSNKNVVQDVGLGRALNYGSLGNGSTATQTLSGEPIGTFWVYKTDGIFQTEEEISANPHIINTQPGDLKIVDVNGDGIIDSEDRVHVGSYQPKLFGGITYSVNWKKFDFGLDIFGNFGNKVYNAKKGVRFGSNYNIELDIAKNVWTPTNMQNEYPRASNVTPYPTDYFVEDGSFVRINNITVGYTFDNHSIWKKLERLRVYVSAQNPFIFTRYSGFTPELPGNQNEAGIELNVYPISSTFIAGVNAQF
ncbi:MAG: TonB-dependent receptor [Saprospiraceae bacterium]|nr:TonB-dependent receptor [Saprospiraceae bacterium]